MLYLLSLGIGLGSIVNGRSGGQSLGTSYLSFLAPALIAATALQVAVGESTYPILYGGFKYQRVYFAMNATPLTARQIAGGVLAWIAARAAFSATLYLVVVACFGGIRSLGALLCVPIATLGAMALAAPIATYSATVETERGGFAAIFRFLVMPMFLFSGTFYPISSLPDWGQALAWLSPLWHATELARWASLGLVATQLRGRPGQRRRAARAPGVPDRADRGRGAAGQLALPGQVEPMSRLELAGAAGAGGPGYPARRGLLLRMLPPSVYAGRATVTDGTLGAGLPPGLADHRVRLLRAAVLPAVLRAGLGALVGGVSGPHGQPLTYAQYIAPALLASSAMNGALNDSMMNVFFKLKYAKLYDGMLATSLAPMDVALGEIGWALTRGGMYTVAFVRGDAGDGTDPVAVGAAAGARGAADRLRLRRARHGGDDFVRNWQDIEVAPCSSCRCSCSPGTFYSLNTYPGWLRLVVQCLPLHHGVAVMRAWPTATSAPG